MVAGLISPRSSSSVIFLSRMRRRSCADWPRLLVSGRPPAARAESAPMMGGLIVDVAIVELSFSPRTCPARLDVTRQPLSANKPVTESAKCRIPFDVLQVRHTLVSYFLEKGVVLCLFARIGLFNIPLHRSGN